METFPEITIEHWILYSHCEEILFVHAHKKFEKRNKLQGLPNCDINIEIFETNIKWAHHEKYRSQKMSTVNFRADGQKIKQKAFRRTQGFNLWKECPLRSNSDSFLCTVDWETLYSDPATTTTEERALLYCTEMRCCTMRRPLNLVRKRFQFS